MIPLVRVVVIAASVALLAGVWLWCAAAEKAEAAERARARVRAVTPSSAGRHRLSATDEQRCRVLVWPGHDPDTVTSGRHALVA